MTHIRWPYVFGLIPVEPVSDREMLEILYTETESLVRTMEEVLPDHGKSLGIMSTQTALEQAEIHLDSESIEARKQPDGPAREVTLKGVAVKWVDKLDEEL